MDSKLDWSTMLAIHGALRRDLEQVARIAGQKDRGDGGRLRASLGWEQFKKFLVAHHQVEDVALWPVLRVHVPSVFGSGGDSCGFPGDVPAGDRCDRARRPRRAADR